MKIFSLDNFNEKSEILESFKDVVVIPTETVYGLAAAINNEYALKRIYSIKGRPSDNPLIVHIGAIEQLDKIVKSIPEEYKRLIEKYWPGPLTLVFQIKENINISSMVCRNKTIAIRMPKSEKLRDIINKLGVPLAAPSANTSGQPSPTNINHVIKDFGEKVPVYIDGGQCEFGLESTVFLSDNGKNILLRPGAVTQEEIEETLNTEIEYKNKIVDFSEPVISPGMKYKHYSPAVPVILYKGINLVENMKNNILLNKNSKIGIMVLSKNISKFDNFRVEIFDLGDDVKEACKNCFLGLRFLEENCEIIYVQGFDNSFEGKAIMDRLEKASTKIFE